MSSTIFTIRIPEVGPMIIDHDGEDIDLVMVDGHALPALIGFDESEDWEPAVYTEALFGPWVQIREWDRENYEAAVAPLGSTLTVSTNREAAQIAGGVAGRHGGVWTMNAATTTYIVAQNTHQDSLSKRNRWLTIQIQP